MKSNSAFRMLCIDASTSHFGFALYVNGKLTEVFGMDFEGVYDTSKLESMWSAFCTVFAKQKINHIVIEKPVPMQFSKAVVQINQVIGMICSVAFFQGITIDWVHNRTAKSIVGITKKGKEGKKQGIELMKALYPTFADRIISDHIADAIVIGEAYKAISESATDVLPTPKEAYKILKANEDKLAKRSTKGYTTTYSEVK